MLSYLLLFLLPYLSESVDSPVVQTNYGPVKGFTIDTKSGKKADIFLGIPFAKPPIGELRLEKPQEPEIWSDVLNVSEMRSACVPHSRAASRGLISEDCLYLNIMRPTEPSPQESGYPVLVWIHGGGFCVGSAHEHHYKAISDNFVSRDLIFVTIQYRLGPYGYLSTGDNVISSNLGYWDQTAALRFVKENIAKFNGDPNMITVSGLSAGGASVSALSISPYSRDLFQNAIEMSGSTFGEWTATDSVIHVTLSLANELNCDISSSVSIKKCLKTKTVDEIFDAVNSTGGFRYALNFIKYNPRIDGEFFPKKFEELIEESPKKTDHHWSY